MGTIGSFISAQWFSLNPKKVYSREDNRVRNHTTHLYICTIFSTVKGSLICLRQNSYAKKKRKIYILLNITMSTCHLMQHSRVKHINGLSNFCVCVLLLVTFVVFFDTILFQLKTWSAYWELSRVRCVCVFTYEIKRGLCLMKWPQVYNASNFALFLE